MPDDYTTGTETVVAIMMVATERALLLAGTPTGVRASISGSHQRTKWKARKPLTISRAVPKLATL
jgi:hypothetical protein